MTDLGLIKPDVFELFPTEVEQFLSYFENPHYDFIISVYWNMRSYRRNNLRTVAYSTNCGDYFGDFKDDPALIDPICQGSLIRYDFGPYVKENIVLFANAASKTRDHMTLKFSSDGANSWEKSFVLYKGPSAYSDLAYNQDGDVCILYERGDSSPYESIVLERYSWAVLQNKMTTLK